MKIAFGTVIYEQAWLWWEEFADSINKQSMQEFDVLILNDGVSSEETIKIKEKIRCKTYIFDVTHSATISEIRIQLLNMSKKLGYDLLVLGDFDDTFSNNRVENIVKEWNEDICFYYHNLKYEDSGDNVFTELPDIVDDIGQILEYNFLGLGNTAINLRLLSNDFISSLENVETNVFDWYLYSKILLYGKVGQLIKDANTIYRQQDNNLAGIQVYDYNSICREIKVKRVHYGMLKKDIGTAEKLLLVYDELEKKSYEQLMKYENKEKKRYWWSNFKILD